jgi:hypothetical protein
MRPAENIPGTGEGSIKESDGGCEFDWSFVNVKMYLQYSNKKM